MIIFIGLAGSGKSTQGQRLAKHLGCPWLSTGQVLRDRVKDPKIIKSMLDGEIIGDEMLMPYLEEELKAAHAEHDQVVLDGSPRTMHQAKWLADKIKKGEIELTAVIHLTAGKETVKKRLLARGRPDDNVSAIEERFREFETTTKPIIGYFKQQGYKVYEIDGEQSPERVEADIDKALGVA